MNLFSKIIVNIFYVINVFFEKKYDYEKVLLSGCMVQSFWYFRGKVRVYFVVL